MSLQEQSGSPDKVAPGSILVVIHDFHARSPDELSLVKNDRIELLERDDDFGDGWYLGRHLKSNRTGLFPEGMKMKIHRSTIQSHTVPAQALQTAAPALSKAKQTCQGTESDLNYAARRFPSSPSHIYSQLRQNAFVRGDISTQHQVEIDRPHIRARGVSEVRRNASHVRQKAALFNGPSEEITWPQPAITVRHSDRLAHSPPTPHKTAEQYLEAEPPPSPCLSHTSASTEVSNCLPLEEYLSCVYTTPQATTATPAMSPPATADVTDPITTAPATVQSSSAEEHQARSPTPPSVVASEPSKHPQGEAKFDFPASTLPPLASPTFSGSSMSPIIPSTAQRNINIATGGQHMRGEESPVMSETLSVIDEHITDMSTPRHSLGAADRRGTNDSGSEYSTHLERRMSYITGELTDEEDQATYTEAQVLQWSPADVAAYLQDVGVESAHCKIFQEQEISGEVLLHMSQNDLFIEAFDLGLLGRRLRTWHKIKALQDEVRSSRPTSRTAEHQYGSDVAGVEETGRARGSVVPTVLPRIPSLMERSGSQTQHDRLNVRQSSQQQPIGGYPMSPSIFSPLASQSSPSRPSAASVRELNQTRRHSSIDVNSTPAAEQSDGGSVEPSTPSKSPASAHKKEPSFDRSWTLGGSMPSLSGGRPSTSTSGREFVGGHKLSTSFDRTGLDNRVRDSGYTTLSPKDIDRGYFSGPEVDSQRTRNVLRKRESGSHSRKSSYTDEQRLRTGTAHSRFGSASSIKDMGFSSISSPSAAQIYHGRSLKDRLRNPAKTNTLMPTRLLEDPTSPTVTKLDNGTSRGSATPLSNLDTDASSSGRGSPIPSLKSPTAVGYTGKRAASGLRAISDAVTGTEKARLASPTLSRHPIAESPIRSPTGTGTSTPSGSKSFDSEVSDARKTANGTASARQPGGTTRKKSKKDTSAYREGLEKKTPQEAMKDCDYSGWMRKKSSKLIAVWNQRLFILKGTRLAYYYSENDDQEKGVIDIAFHRVLTAENDRITGLHATLTGAAGSPTSPLGATTPTSASTDAAAEPVSSLQKAGNESIFIFKLVPPRAGLPKAVTFTMPKVHYFAVDNIKQGRLWMAALMKATIDRDDTSPITSTYQLKTISLNKARAMRQRPPALMGPDDKVDEEPAKEQKDDHEGLNITGITFGDEADVDHSQIGLARSGSNMTKSSS